MSDRKIVMFFDGTANEIVTSPTNVLRMMRCLNRDDDLLMYYQPGIGTLMDRYAISRTRKWARKIWDMATAFSLGEGVIAGYTELVRLYEPGDRVYLIGFSRGAYTARAVHGMLRMFGLVRASTRTWSPTCGNGSVTTWVEQRNSSRIF